MSPAQADLLRRLIEADRDYHRRLLAGEPVHRDDRGVEVASINGVHRATARALADAGVVEIVDIGKTMSGWAFLGSYDPHTRIEVQS